MSRAGIAIEVNWEGMPELMRALKRVEGDAKKRSELLKIYKRQSAPYRRAAKKTIPKSEGKKNHSRVEAYRPGNLRRSIKSKAFRKNPKNPLFTAVWTGPDTKKAKGSGYYGYFLLQDTIGGKPGWRRNDWKDKAWQSSKNEIERGITRDLAKHIKKQFGIAGFEVK